MKNMNFTFDEIFGDHALTAEEMICVKGGDAGEPIIIPATPPIKI